VKSEPHKKICKAIIRGGNADRVILDVMCQSNPAEVIHGCQKLIQEECKNVSKRGSGTVLQNKGYYDFFDFKWEDQYDEIKQKCPALLSVITSIISDVPVSISTKPFLHIMLTTAIGLHGRSQEMSVTQFLTGFLLTHGGCTHRVIFLEL